MPKKQKKILTRKSKTKNKNTVNVKINIDNSRKTTARRTPLKPSNMQPFVNFPTFQPARIQQLEPLKKYNNGDLTKVDDLYQQQFKTYFETSNKNIKDMIAKFDDTLKKNIAPQKTEESKPGASKVYADTEGETVLEEPIKIKKTQITVSEPTKEDSNLKGGFGNWNKSNEIKQNNMSITTATKLPENQLNKSGFVDFSDGFDKQRESYQKYRKAYAELYGVDDNKFIDINSDKGRFKGVKGWELMTQQLKEKQPEPVIEIDSLFEQQGEPVEAEILDEEKIIDEAIDKETSTEKLNEKGKKIQKKVSNIKLDGNYKKYVNAYKTYYNNENYKQFEDLNKKGGKFTSANWGSMATSINDKIKQYGTYLNEEDEKDEKQLSTPPVGRPPNPPKPDDYWINKSK